MGIPCLLLAISYRGSFKVYIFLSYRKLIRYTCTQTVETGNEFSISDDEKTANYELNVARHAFSCSMRSVRLLQYSCMRCIPWLYTTSLTYLFFSHVVRFSDMGTEWGNISNVFAVFLSPSLCTTLTYLVFLIDDVHFVSVSV
jgi:hypothetical protein